MNLLLGHGLLIEAHPFEPLWLKNGLGDDSIDQRVHANADAYQMLIEGERHSAGGMTTVLNHGDLNCDGAYYNENEKAVVEEALENIVLLGTELARVDLVEDLHENERVEDHGVKSDLIQVGEAFLGSRIISWVEALE